MRRTHAPTAFSALALTASLVAVVVPSASRADVPPSASPPSAPPPSPPPPALPSLAAVKYQLPNGLEVILHEDHRTPTVTTNIWYHVGSKDEPAHKNGFAHLFEHVMFQGSKHVAEDTFFRHLEQAGGTGVNGTTNTDRTNYFETVPKNRLELALWLESDRMGFLLDHADLATFQSQREVVKNERRQNYENAPYGLVVAFTRAELFPPGHPYHLLTIGTPEDLDNATMEDVRGFFHTWYRPGNATLVVAGDMEPTTTKALVEKYFGSIPANGEPERRTLPARVTRTEPTRLEVVAGVELPRVTMSWVTPSFFASGDAELDILAHVLSEGKTSRLYKRLVYDLQIAQSVSASQQSMQFASVFEITATAKPGHTPDELLAEIDKELELLEQKGATDVEISRAKTVMEAGVLFDLERGGGRANRLNTYNHYTGNPQYLEEDILRTRRVAAQAMMETQKRLLGRNSRVVTVVTVEKDAPVAGRLVKTVKGGAK